jgi:hypothetical protein
MFVLSACGSGRVQRSPADQKLAARIAPVAADLGPTWVEVHVQGQPRQCGPSQSACLWRSYGTSRNQLPLALAAVDIYPSAAAAGSAFKDYGRNLTRVKDMPVPTPGTVITASFVSRTPLTAPGGRAALVRLRDRFEKPKRMSPVFNYLFLTRGRAFILLSLGSDPNVEFNSTARSIALRIGRIAAAATNS